MKKIGLLVILIAGAAFAQPQNNGWGFANNGACTPFAGIPGICNDNGTLVWYDANANKSALSLPGPQGPAGPAGQGVPTGGTAGQVLTKNSSTNYDTLWQTPSGGGGGVINALHKGGMWSDGRLGTSSMRAIAVGAPAASANALYALQFTLPAALTIGHASIQIGTGLASSWVQFGVYDSNGNKLIDSGQFATTTSATKMTNSFTGVTLNAGVYYFVYEASAITTLTIYGENFSTDVAFALANNLSGNTAFGTCANGASGGALPATLGTITPLVSGTSYVPAVWWEF